MGAGKKTQTVHTERCFGNDDSLSTQITAHSHTLTPHHTHTRTHTLHPLPWGVPCRMFSVRDLWASFWLLMIMANRNFSRAASSTISAICKSSGMIAMSTINALCRSLDSILSAYPLKVLTVTNSSKPSKHSIKFNSSYRMVKDSGHKKIAISLIYFPYFYHTLRWAGLVKMKLWSL